MEFGLFAVGGNVFGRIFVMVPQISILIASEVVKKKILFFFLFCCCWFLSIKVCSYNWYYTDFIIVKITTYFSKFDQTTRFWKNLFDWIFTRLQSNDKYTHTCICIYVYHPSLYVLSVCCLRTVSSLILCACFVLSN